MPTRLDIHVGFGLSFELVQSSDVRVRMMLGTTRRNRQELRRPVLELRVLAFDDSFALDDVALSLFAMIQGLLLLRHHASHLVHTHRDPLWRGVEPLRAAV
jgi:hypothetical protein